MSTTATERVARQMKAASLMIPKPLLQLGAAQMRIELDKKSLFALASDTRLEILKSLQPMRRTVSQLSEALNIDKAAVHRHLKKMEEGGLVKRYEEHGFVYYGLSWKARDLISPNENTRIVVLLSSAFLLILAAAFFIAVGFVATDNFSEFPTRSPTSSEYDAGSADGLMQLAEESPATWMLPVFGLGAAAAAASVVALRWARRPRQTIDNKVESSDVQRPVPED
jgi:DNA-binding transcriptional ArsR family regulator